jgi:hypothetical protein
MMWVAVPGYLVFNHLQTPKNVTSPMVLPDWKPSLANGSGSTGTESPGASSEEVG